MKLVLASLVFALTALTLASGPKAGTYVFKDAKGLVTTITLAAHGKNFTVTGRLDSKDGAPGSVISGTLFGATSKLKATVKTPGLLSTGVMNGYWNHTHSRLEVSLPESRRNMILIPKQVNDLHVPDWDFSGKWQTNMGDFELKQFGTKVTGTTDLGLKIDGAIRADHKLYIRIGLGAADGQTAFCKLSADGQSFTGSRTSYIKDGSGQLKPVTAGWTGKRISGDDRERAVDWTGTWTNSGGGKIIIRYNAENFLEATSVSGAQIKIAASGLRAILLEFPPDAAGRVWRARYSMSKEDPNLARGTLTQHYPNGQKQDFDGTMTRSAG